MKTDRELMQQALEAMDTARPACFADNTLEAIDNATTALRERLAQPDAYGYASRLAVAIWERHYKDVAPQWKPLDDLMGVLTQIDNMTSGLTRLAQPEEEPVAWMYHGIRHDDTPHERPSLIWKPEYMDVMSAEKGAKATPLYTAPRQWQGLTRQEFLAVTQGLEDLEDCWMARVCGVEK